jgi:hypothetical protein
MLLYTQALACSASMLLLAVPFFLLTEAGQSFTI